MPLLLIWRQRNNIKDGDRIIQFCCALVQNGKIIQTISQDVNPLRDVPTKIQHLTAYYG